MTEGMPEGCIPLGKLIECLLKALDEAGVDESTPVRVVPEFGAAREALFASGSAVVYPGPGHADMRPYVVVEYRRAAADDGRLFREHLDAPLDKRCPACGRYEVEYNGNYYCCACDWGLAEDGDVQPWLRSLIRLRRLQGLDTAREEEYLTPASRKKLRTEVAELQDFLLK